MPVAERCISWRAHKIYRSHNRDTSAIVSPEGSSRPPPHESAIFFLPRFVWTGPETTLESGFKRMRFGWAVWTNGRFVKTYINYGVSFFSKLSVFLLVCYTAVADYHLVGVTYDRSRSTATRTYKSNKFRLFRIFWKPNIFLHDLAIPRASTQSIRIRAIMLFQCPDRFVWMGL